MEQQLDAILASPLAGLAGADKPVGYIGLDMPIELILSGTRTFCHLPWRHHAETPQADQWLENKFPGWARSMLESWFSGEFDIFDQVVFSRGEDGSHRLYYYVCELQNRGVLAGPRPLIFDIAKIDRPSSVARCKQSIQRLMEILEIPESALATGTAKANDWRELTTRLEMSRSGPGRLYEKIARACLFSEQVTKIAAGDMPDASPAGKVLLTGSAPPNDFLHLAAETVGWNIIGELHARSLSRFGPAIDADSDPLLAMAHFCNSSPFGQRAFGSKGEVSRQAVKDKQPDAVVIWLTENDEVTAWHLPAQRRVLDEAGIPYLVLTRRAWDGTDGCAEALTVFLEELTP